MTIGSGMSQDKSTNQSPRVAIIGGGVAGATAANYAPSFSSVYSGTG